MIFECLVYFFDFYALYTSKYRYTRIHFSLHSPIFPSLTPLHPPRCQRKKVRWKAARKAAHSKEPSISSWLPGSWDSSEAIFVGRSLCQLFWIFSKDVFHLLAKLFFKFYYLCKLRFWERLSSKNFYKESVTRTI